jgi:hypothetical protein
MLKIRTLALITATLGIAAPVLAQEMRCGERLISGDEVQPLLKTQVLEICGEPTTKDFDRWYYQEQQKILVFNGNDELDHIEDAEVPE